MRRFFAPLLLLAAACPSLAAAQSPVPFRQVLPAGNDSITVHGNVAVNAQPGAAGSVVVSAAVKIDSVIRPVRVDTLWDTVPAPLPSLLVGSAPAPVGLAWGPLHTPIAKLNDTTYGFTGTVRYGVKAAVLAAQLDSVKAHGGKMSFAPTSQRLGFVSNGKFLTQRWRDTFNFMWSSSLPLLQQAIADGRIDKLYPIDEPDCAPCWGNAVITPQQVDSLAMFLKSKLGNVPVVARVTPDWYLKANYVPKAIDLAWAQYEGKYHTPGFGLTPEQFRDKEVAAAKQLGMGLILGINVLDGGNGPCVSSDSGSALPGTFAVDPNPTDGTCKDPTTGSYYRYQTSPYEFEHAYTVFVEEPYVCAAEGWKWSDASSIDGLTTAQKTAIQTYYSRSSIIAASKRISAIARVRNPGPCHRTP